MVNLTIKDLFSEPVKVILIIVGLAVSLLMVHVSFGMVNGTVQESTRAIEESDYEAYIMQKNKPNIMMGGEVSDQIYEELRNSSAVKKVDRIIDSWTGLIYDEENVGVGIYGIEIGKTNLQPWNIIEGDSNELKQDNKIIVDKMILKFLPDIEIGDIVKAGVLNEELEIVGFCENSQRMGNPTIWTNFNTAKSLLYMENESSYLAIQFNNGYNTEDMDGFMKENEDKIRIFSRDQMEENVEDYIINDMGLGGSIGILAGIGFFVAMMVLSITLYQSVSQKLEELVTLKALGASKGQINRMLLGQVFFMVTIGYAISVATAILLSPALSWVSSLSVYIEPTITILSYGICLILGSICSIFSIRKVHSTDPAIIFRA